jgi:hypothetical protein
MTHHFCTYFDGNYWSRAASLLDSLDRHCPSFTLHMLCMDDVSFEKVNALGRSHVVSTRLSELERALPELMRAKSSRSLLEYYFTCGPAFIRYVLDRNPAVDVITYLDADLYFFHDPQPLFDAFQGHSIGVIAHHLPTIRKRRIFTAYNLPAFRRRRIREGKYNVGWLNFRRDADGIACLEWWRDRCLEWCYDRYENGKYADQLYLNQFPLLFQGFYEFTHHGANVAMWNVGEYRFSLRGNSVYVDDDPLIFYHFHGFKKIASFVYNANTALHLQAPPAILKRHVFAEYIEKLEHHATETHAPANIRTYRPSHYIMKSIVRHTLGLIFRQYIIYYNGYVI